MPMPPHLGLVCITVSNDVRYRTITRKRLLEHSFESQQKLLDELYRSNIQVLDRALRSCAEENIALYRLPSSIFPFADEPIGRDLLATFAQTLARTGARALERGIRLVMHPDQFVVLSSDSAGVVANSGKADRVDALVANIAALPDAIRCRLGLENDEYAYSAEEIYDICVRSGVPMVLDAHHHIVHEKLDSYDHPSIAEMLAKARSTWAVPEHQLVHISNGRTAFNDRQHSDLIETMPAAYAQAPWIEIEAKNKEEAIRGLRQWQAAAA